MKRTCALIAIGQEIGATGRISAQGKVFLSVFQRFPAAGTKRQKGRKTVNKYGAKKWELDGKTFDSHHEAKRYQELRWLQMSGLITDLKLQVPFELLPTQRVNGKVVERPIKYIADFVYQEKEPNGESHTVVEDAKGMRTKEYVIKRKLMLAKYGIQIREV